MEAGGIQIEKGVPISTRRGNRVYPFASLAVGDSFSVPCDLEAERRLRCAASQWAKRNSKRLTVSRQGVNCRVWRLEDKGEE